MKFRLQAISIIIVIWAAAFSAMLFPQARLWGINHLNFLPDIFIPIYTIGGILVLLLLIPVLRIAAGSLYGSAANLIFDQTRPLRWAIISLAALALFWIFRMPIHLLGDSYSVMENIGNDLPVIMKWSEIGAIAAAAGVARLLPMSGTELGQYSYEIISVVSGAVTFFFMLGLAYELSKEAVGRLLIWVLAVAAGWIVLFFGHAENYPILWPFISGYIYFGIRYINGSGRLLWPTLFLLAAMICHMQTLFFAASYLVLPMAHDRTRKSLKKPRSLIMAIGAVLVIALGGIFIWIYRNSPEIGYLLMPLFGGRPATPDYWLFSPSHLLDIFNQYMLLAPLLPLLMITAWKRWHAIAADKIDLFLLVMTVGGFAFVFIIDPKLGMARDWDLYALVGLPPMLLFGRSLANSGPKRAVIFPSIAIMAVFMAMPFIAVNLNSQSAMDRYKYLLNLDLPKGRVGITFLESMYREQGDTTTADSLHAVLVKSFPAITQVPMAMSLYQQGRYAEALSIITRLAELEPNSNEILSMRGLTNMRLGNRTKAIEDLERAAKGGQYDSRILGNLAVAYQTFGDYDMAIKTWRRGQKLDPNANQIINGLMSVYFDLAQFDSAIVYGTKMIESTPDKPHPYFVVGLSAYQLKYFSAAKKYLTQYLEIAPENPNRAIAESTLRKLP